MKFKTLAKLMVFPALLVTSCNNASSAPEFAGTVTIKDVKYDAENNRIQWKIVTTGLAVVSNYTITVDGEQKTQNYNGASGSYFYNAQGRDFEFSIVCNDNLKRHAQHSTTFTNLGTCTDLAYDGNGRVTWLDSFELADHYQVKCNGKESTVTEKSIAVPAGVFSVQVKPTGTPDANGNYSSYSKWSETFRGTLLATPGNLAFDSEKISWSTVSGASSYTLQINGDQITGLTTSTYPFAGHTEDISVAVKAVGDGASVYDSMYSTTKDYKYLTPVQPEVENGIVKWNPPAGATRYKYKLNGVVQSEFLTEARYEKLVAGVQTRIQILPMGAGDNTYSEWSPELSVIILESPRLRYNNNVIIWDPITGAGGYAVKVVDPTGEIYQETLSGDTFAYDYPFEKAGTYSVYVKANGDGNQGYYDSKFSQALEVVRLPKPGTYNLYSNPEASKQLTISCAAVTRASGYVLYANNKEVGNNTNPTFDVDVNSLDDRKDRLDIVFKIMSKGSTNSSPIALDSLEGCEFNATRLGTPTNVRSSESVLYWDSVTDANGYIVSIDDDSNRVKVIGTSFDLKLLTPGTHKVYVQAYGNGTNLITSRESDPITITRLEKPVLHIELNTDYQRYYVAWQEIIGSTGYVVKVGNNSFNATSNFFNLTNGEDNFAEGRGNQLSVMAVGDGSSTIDSDYSDTSTIIRHARPTDLALSGNNLIWQYTNVDTIAPTKFEVDLTGTVTKNEKISGSSYDLSQLPAGTYSVRVKTLGEYYDGTINSPYSDTFSFRKLEAVSSIIRDGTSIRWSSIPYATRYDVRISGQTNPIQVTNPELDLKPYIGTAAGVKEIKITAIGNSSNILNSNEFVENQTIVELSRPTFGETSSSVPYFTIDQDGANITIKIYPNTVNYTGYDFIIGGISHKFSKLDNPTGTYQFALDEPGHYYNIKTALLGGLFGENDYYYLDSQQSAPVQVIWNG